MLRDKQNPLRRIALAFRDTAGAPSRLTVPHISNLAWAGTELVVLPSVLSRPPGEEGGEICRALRLAGLQAGVPLLVQSLWREGNTADL